MTHIPSSNELPPPSVEAVPLGVPDEANEQLSRRNFLGMAGRSAVVVAGFAVGAELTATKPAEAQPDDDPVDPSTPPTREELELIRTQIEQLRAERDNLIANTGLLKRQREQLERSLNPPSFIDGASKFISDIATPISIAGGIVGGVAVGTVGASKYFREKRQDRIAREDAIREDEDKRYALALEKIMEVIDRVSAEERELPPEQVNYSTLHLAYSQLKAFTGKERFAERIFDDTVSLLRDRAKALIRRTEYQIEVRSNSDRQLIQLLTTVAPQLPRKDEEGNAILPDAAGISLNGTRFLRRPLERVSLEGAYLQRLTITGSLAGSHLKLTHLGGATLGQPGLICDLRGTDLSKADLDGATFAHVLIDEYTKFGAGEEGNPTATFENVTSDDTLTKEELAEKIRAAQDIISTWQQQHPTPASKPESKASATNPPGALRKFLSTIGITQA